MSIDFPDRAPLLPESPPTHAVRPDHWPMIPSEIASLFALFLLCSFILFVCHRVTDTHASPLSDRRRNNHISPPLPPPPPPAAVAALPLVRVGTAHEFYCCAVCLSEYDERESVKLMPVCGHVFHPVCIDKWLLSRGTCPVCRCSDLARSRAGELRLDVFEDEGERREEEEEEEEEESVNRNQRKIGRSKSCSSCVEVEGMGVATVFLQRSCSF